jgi:hypothetical protein
VPAGQGFGTEHPRGGADERSDLHSKPEGRVLLSGVVVPGGAWAVETVISDAAVGGSRYRVVTRAAWLGRCHSTVTTEACWTAHTIILQDVVARLAWGRLCVRKHNYQGTCRDVRSS